LPLHATSGILAALCIARFQNKGERVNKRCNNISFVFGVPGFFLQFAGSAMNQPLVLIIGSVLLMIGLAYYAKGKKRNPAWCLMGFLPIVGIIVLACLKDREEEPTLKGL